MGFELGKKAFPGSKLERFGREQTEYRSEAYFQKATGSL